MSGRTMCMALESKNYPKITNLEKTVRTDRFLGKYVVGDNNFILRKKVGERIYRRGT